MIHASNEIIDMHVHVPEDEGLLTPMMEAFSKNGISRAFISCLGPGQWLAFPDDIQVSEANELTFSLCRKSDGFYRGYVYLNPFGSWRPELEKWLDHACFIGVKLWISLKDNAGNADSCLPVLEESVHRHFPVLIHSFFRNGGNLAGEVNPNEVVHLARNVPESTIVLAHMGGCWEKGLKAIRDQKNIHVDVSGGSPIRNSVETAVEICGEDRVLFGSDMPCRTVQSQLYKVTGSMLSEQAKRKIVRDNIQRIYGQEKL